MSANSVKKFALSAVAVVFILGNSLYAQQSAPDASKRADYPRFSAEAGPVFVTGSATEDVYRDSSTTALLSQLVWPIPPSLGAAVDFRAQWAPWIETKLSLQGTAAVQSGNMTDDDWNVDYGGKQAINLHSDNDAYLQTNWQGSLEVAGLYRTPVFTFKFLLGALYQELYWEAWNTRQVNTFLDGSQSSGNYAGLSGTFRQDWFIPYLGIGAAWSLGDSDWSVEVHATPFVLDTQTDAHILRQLAFTETLTDGFMIEPKLSIGVHLFGSTSLVLDLGFRYVAGVRGDEVESQSGNSTPGFVTFTSTAGAGITSFTGGIGIKTGF